MNVSREFLYRSTSNPDAIKESEYEFVEYICESMVSLGSSNLQCIAGDDSALALYLQLVIALAIDICQDMFCTIFGCRLSR